MNPPWPAVGRKFNIQFLFVGDLQKIWWKFHAIIHYRIIENRQWKWLLSFVLNLNSAISFFTPCNVVSAMTDNSKFWPSASFVRHRALRRVNDYWRRYKVWKKIAELKFKTNDSSHFHWWFSIILYWIIAWNFHYIFWRSPTNRKCMLNLRPAAGQGGFKP